MIDTKFGIKIKLLIDDEPIENEPKLNQHQSSSNEIQINPKQNETAFNQFNSVDDGFNVQSVIHLKTIEEPIITRQLNLDSEVRAQMPVDNKVSSVGEPNFQEYQSFISEEITEFIPIELSQLLNNIRQQEENLNSPEEIKAERDALLKLIENIKHIK